MKALPTCSTCVFFEDGTCDIEKDVAFVPFQTFDTFLITSPSKFFCSEHKTKDGERFVNWPK